jgi:MFS family permease
MRSVWPRLALSVLLGNALGLGANWAAARIVLPWLWADTNLDTGFWARVGLVAASFILLAAPPVLAGALGAWLAQRAQLWVGLACGLWGFILIGAVPDVFPIAAGVWYAPTVLVILSSALGGWMLDMRASARLRVSTGE